MAPRLILDADTVRRFWRKVRKTDGCWIWIGARNGATPRAGRAGYGTFAVPLPGGGFHYMKAHRASWAIANDGQLPPMVLHRCDNPPCVRPDHLLPGTHAANMADAVTKGRMHLGELHGNAKLTTEIVLAIRALHRDGLGPSAIGRRLGLVKTTVWSVTSRRNWRHIA